MGSGSAAEPGRAKDSRLQQKAGERFPDRHQLQTPRRWEGEQAGGNHPALSEEVEREHTDVPVQRQWP